MSWIRKLDYFTKPKEEVDSSSNIGGLFSILAFIFGTLLFAFEIYSFSKVEVVTSLSVDSDMSDKNVPSTISLLFPHMPCQLIYIYMNEADREVAVPTLKQKILSKDLNFIKEHIKEGDKSYFHRQGLAEEVSTAILNGEQCEIDGNFTLKEVDSLLNLNAIFSNKVVESLKPEVREKLSFEFTMRHLSFGHYKDKDKVEKVYRDFDKRLHPFDGTHFPFKDGGNIFFKLVPNNYHVKKRKEKTKERIRLY